jgi:hypothetical protein
MTPCGSDEVVLLPVVGRSVLAPDVLSQNRELIREFGIAQRRNSDSFAAILSVPNSRRAIRRLQRCLELKWDREASSGSGAVVFQTRKPPLKAQGETFADFYLSAQRV